MNITPEQFLQSLKEGKSERSLNLNEDLSYSNIEYKKLTSKDCGHSHKSAVEHLRTDYTNGFTICDKCGSYYHLGKGFTKHLSNGCLHCEGQSKHRTYHVEASPPKYGGFPARWMSVMFDNGMHYCKDELQVEKYRSLVPVIHTNELITS